MKSGRLHQLLNWTLDTGNNDYLAIISEVSLFKGLNKSLLRKLLIDLFEKEYAAGEIIFSEGDCGKALYIVMSGSVNIVKKSDSGDKVVAPLAPGSYFGELALINESPRFATAIATEKTHLLIMYKSYFDSLITGNSRLSSRILLNLAHSLSLYIYSEKL